MGQWTVKCLLPYEYKIVLFLAYICLTKAFFDRQARRGDVCFCQLQGQVGDCSCSVDTVDHFNNVKVYPRMASLITKEYFRFYKVNLKKECPFWIDDSRCAMKHCSVEHCLDDAPPVIKSYSSRKNQPEDMSVKYLDPSLESTGECPSDADLNEELGYLNTTISAAAMEEFALWQAFDDALDTYCFLPEDDPDADYVDLLLNPERYTGYRGNSAHKIWNSIYKENCFMPKHSFDAYIQSTTLNGMCLEQRVFYRVISGLHTSINIHLSAKFLLSDITGHWGPNLEEFHRRFSPEATNGEGPEWIRNLYFVYLLEMRAIVKAAPYLEQEEYFTGRQDDDSDTKDAVYNLLDVIKTFPEHFNESTMFSGGAQAAKLKEEFSAHFRNITSIMDCVGCDKCKLWGKLQIQGLGTALKILFSGKFDHPSPTPYSVAHLEKKQFQLERNEIVALFNSFGRLSTSIYELERVRQMMR